VIVAASSFPFFRDDPFKKIFQPVNVFGEIVFLSDDLKAALAHRARKSFIAEKPFDSFGESAAIHPGNEKTVETITEPVLNSARIKSHHR